MPKYQFETDETIKRCVDCGFYREEDYKWDKEHFCILVDIAFCSEGYGYKDEDDEGALEIFDKNRAELFKQCPLKLIKE